MLDWFGKINPKRKLKEKFGKDDQKQLTNILSHNCTTKYEGHIHNNPRYPHVDKRNIKWEKKIHIFLAMRNMLYKQFMGDSFHYV